MMKKLLASALCAAASTFALLPDSLSLQGQVNLQAQKFFGPSEVATQETDNNLDQWYGEAILGTSYQNEGFSSQLELTMYPVGFGVRPREVTY